MDLPYVKLIGQPVVRFGEQEFPLPRTRASQLLCYLASASDWVSRSDVAGMLWPRHDEESARRNLRRVLFDARANPWAASIESRGDALRWRVGSDQADFMAAFVQQRWQDCIDLGIGIDAFLEGMDIGKTNAYGEWLFFERERVNDRWRQSVARLRTELRDDAIARLELSLRALEEQPHDEEAMAHAAQALRSMGSDADAEAMHHRFTARLERDLGVLAPDTRPLAGTHFVGRKLEQLRVAHVMGRDECRVLTIHGSGGVGKTALARQSQRALEGTFRDGAVWIPVAAVKNELEVIERIEREFGLRAPTSLGSGLKLDAAIANREFLLILDGCEHLPRLGALTEQLVAQAPGLKVLHTSRLTMRCAGEHLMQLEGLPCPDWDEQDPEIIRNFDAVRLFELHARQADPMFDPYGSIQAVQSIVRRVDGIPLAIELAASLTSLNRQGSDKALANAA